MSIAIEDMCAGAHDHTEDVSYCQTTAFSPCDMEKVHKF